MIDIIHIILFVFLAVIGIAIIRLRDLFAAVMLAGIFSLLSATLFTVMDAVDVAFTEAAVGAGISTLLMLATLSITSSEEKPAGNRRQALIGLVVVTITGAALIYGTLDMPHYGDPDAPIHHHMAPRFMEDSPEEIGIPNQVTSILASYRGYDTWGETTVILAAAIGVMLLFATPVVSRRREEEMLTPGEGNG